MVISICIGSSCHLKGSRAIVQRLETLVAENKLQDRVALNGSFCIGECVKGVCVKMDEKIFSLTPDGVDTFFEEEVLRRLA